MTESDPKAELHFYLTRARDALLWKTEALSEYDVRRPLVPTGTNLLGLVKHVAGVTARYFGECFGRPFALPVPWLDDDEPNAGMFATAEESREWLASVYRDAWAHADATFDALPLDATGEVPWWPPERRYPTLRRVTIHMIAETERHAGHADIVRELIDGSVGVRAGYANPPEHEPAWWMAYRDRVEQAAKDAGAR
ncbi:MAG TPA: DinB family protein [Micromonosporaceae bacterium]|jgi:hypothetical protein